MVPKLRVKPAPGAAGAGPPAETPAACRTASGDEVPAAKRQRADGAASATAGAGAGTSGAGASGAGAVSAGGGRSSAHAGANEAEEGLAGLLGAPALLQRDGA